MPRTITFDRTFPYLAVPRGPTPRVPVRVMHPSNPDVFLDLSMLVDSGADVTTLPFEIATYMGINLATLASGSSTGVGGRVQSYTCPDMALFICGVEIRPCPVSFLSGLSELLLGRAKVFDLFSFGFEQGAWSVHVRLPVTPVLQSLADY